MSDGPVAITGASGLVGRRLCQAFLAVGRPVIAFVREPEGLGDLVGRVRVSKANLPGTFDEAALTGASALVHCAYDTVGLDPERALEVNVEGTRRVWRASRRCGVRQFVFLSSLSSHAHARSTYGRTKWMLESEMDPEKDLIVRAGLVLAESGGLIGTMIDWLRRFPVVPIPGGRGTCVQTVHADDLAAAIVRAVETGATGALSIAHPEAVPFATLLGALGNRMGRRRILVPVPVGLVHLGLRALERLPLSLPRHSERVMGLRDTVYVDTRSSLQRLGLSVRPWSEALQALP